MQAFDGTALGFGACLGVVAVLLCYVLLGVRYIPNDRLGVVEKRWSGKGGVKSGLIALAGEAGFQPQVLRGGVHWLTPFQYRIHTMALVTIPQGKIGYIFARDGKPLGITQALAANVGVDFQDVAEFFAAGGQRGPQRQILREGTYAINLAQFSVITEREVFYLPLNRNEEAIFREMATTIDERGGFDPVIIKGSDDLVAIVTVHEGPSLAQGEIIASIVGCDPEREDTYHNNFQDPEKFLAAGGRRGRQLQVLVEGTYFINRLFATVEMVPKTTVEVGTVGVVVSYTGELGRDISGHEYKHGELVAKGTRGVWSDPLLPGKYAFNTYAGKVIMVPTTNFILKWNRAQMGTHKFDENLTEVSLITKDAFEPSLPLSVVVHIDYRKAPLVIQRFGDIKKLVEQTLDPMVAAYFKNVGQTRTLIQLLQERSSIQTLAADEMKEKFAHYNLELEEVLIGTPASSSGDLQIETILTQLRQRQIAEEQVETYARQEKAAVKERELREAEARAKQQARLTESELGITVEANLGRAAYQRSLQEVEQIKAMSEAEAGRVRTMATADADRVRVMANAEAERAARVGMAEALATEEQVRAYGGPRYQLTQEVMTKFADAIAAAKVDVVPRIVMGGSANGGQGNVLESLLALMLSDKLGGEVSSALAAPPRPEIEALRDDARRHLSSRLQRAEALPPSTNGGNPAGD